MRDVIIRADHPGGNIICDRIDGDTVHLRQDIEKGVEWNKGGMPTAAAMFLGSGAACAFTFELAYFGMTGGYTQEAFVDFGRDFADAVISYLREDNV